MRWFIEVSRVGEAVPTEKYCLEAKQWQAALQEARKLRGDAGPLSKFSIELLDDGYRAVDPTLKIRYIVAKAPSDAPISVPGNNGGGNHATAAARASEPAPRTEPMASPEPLPIPSRVEVAPKTDPMGSPPPSAPASASAAQAARTERAAAKPLQVPPDPVPPPPRPSAPAQHPVTAHPTQRSLEVAKAPDFQLIRKREEEPSAQSPIAYREYAYAVKPGTDRRAAEVLLWIRFKEIQTAIEERPNGKFVQLAVFDHVFERKPVRPPIATLAWKDWRGEPVLTFIDAPASASAAPPRPSAAPLAAVASVAPAPAASVAPAPAASVAPAPAASVAPAPAASVAPAPSASVAPAAPASIAPASAPTLTVEELSVDVDLGLPESVPPSASAGAVPAWPTSSAPSDKPSAPPSAKPSVAPASKPSAPPVTQPSPVQAQARAHAQAQARAQAAALAEAEAPRRRKPGEDLIGDLFELMHELHFVSDIVSGAQFVLGITQRLLPSSGAIVHVFDINTRHFVVVRAAGPNAAQVLLHRTPDKDPLFVEAMRRTRSLRFDDVGKDERFNGGRWSVLGIEPRCALVGPVQQGGRYLGVIELANPDGGSPYHEGESNALDYICEQFAEFVAARPIVVDADVIIGKA